MIIGMACSEILAWLDINVTVDGACKKSPGHLPWVAEDGVTVTPVTPLSGDPKRFFISPNSTSPWDTWRRWRDTAAISSSLFAGARDTHFLRRDRLLFIFFLSFLLSFLSYFSENLYFIELKVPQSRPALCRNHFSRNRRGIIVRSFDKIIDMWRVKFRGSFDLSCLAEHRSGTFIDSRPS